MTQSQNKYPPKLSVDKDESVLVRFLYDDFKEIPARDERGQPSYLYRVMARRPGEDEEVEHSWFASGAVHRKVQRLDEQKGAYVVVYKSPKGEYGEYRLYRSDENGAIGEELVADGDGPSGFGTQSSGTAPAKASAPAPAPAKSAGGDGGGQRGGWGFMLRLASEVTALATEHWLRSLGIESPANSEKINSMAIAYERSHMPAAALRAEYDYGLRILAKYGAIESSGDAPGDDTAGDGDEPDDRVVCRGCGNLVSPGVYDDSTGLCPVCRKASSPSEDEDRADRVQRMARESDPISHEEAERLAYPRSTGALTFEDIENIPDRLMAYWLQQGLKAGDKDRFGRIVAIDDLPF